MKNETISFTPTIINISEVMWFQHFLVWVYKRNEKRQLLFKKTKCRRFFVYTMDCRMKSAKHYQGCLAKD